MTFVKTVAINISKRLFPRPPDNNMNGFILDNEGLWSITHPIDADLISTSIKDIMGTNELHILDMTAGCGGNMISFIKQFVSVTGVEIDEERFTMLTNNLNKYNQTNYTLINGNSIDHINSTYDVFYIDPPWGGPDYKMNDMMDLYLSDINLVNIVHMIPYNKLIVMKLPYNYNIAHFKDYIIKQLEIHNIIILFIKYNYQLNYINGIHLL